MRLQSVLFASPTFRRRVILPSPRGRSWVEAMEPRLLLTTVPGLTSTIEAINYNQDSTLNGGPVVPPDPNGAAGPTQVVNVGNDYIEWYTKAGVQQVSESSFDFFAPAFGSFAVKPPDLMSDPKVVYDQYQSRFVVTMVALSFVELGGANESNLCVAVSKDSNPNDGWWFQAISSNVTISTKDYFPDFPQLGIDQNAVYITGNMFDYDTQSAFGGTRLWILGKTDLYAGGASTVHLFDPVAASGAVEGLQTLQPAHLYGTLQGGAGEFLVSATDSNGIELHDLNGADYVDVMRIDNPLSASPTFTNQLILLGATAATANIESSALPGPAPQLTGELPIETNDARVLGAVWRNGSLWAVNTINPNTGPDAGQATAHWYKIDTSVLANLSLTDQGSVGGEDIAVGTWTYMPSIAVDGAGDMAIGFSASGDNLLAGAYYTGRRASDPAGTVENSAAVAEGQDGYVRTFGGGVNRWGDYSGISVDPSDDKTFWIYNQYALTRDPAPDAFGEDGLWGTRWGSFAFPDVIPLAPTLLSRTIDDGNNQRSLVRSLTFKFSSPVTLSAGAITLALLNTAGSNSGTDDGAPPTNASAALGTPTTSDAGVTWVVPIVQSSAFSVLGSLIDGVYQTTVHAALVSDASSRHLSGGDQTGPKFHRLFGDINGDKRVNASDYQQFSAAFGSSNLSPNYVVYFDYNHDKRINATDYQQFAARFGKFYSYVG
ncbi:MAG: Hemolysin-type calcium-binding repeat family protein [Phycisphaerales bacterium]|nr:Hemolysin-type calcium-binding repeat family protein [Phycisphaerales bacterium]